MRDEKYVMVTTRILSQCKLIADLADRGRN